jgi:hypothetical protein
MRPLKKTLHQMFLKSSQFFQHDCTVLDLVKTKSSWKILQNLYNSSIV